MANNSNVETLVKRYFPTAVFNEEEYRYEVKIRVSSSSWDKPQLLEEMDEDWTDAAAQKQLNGANWDNDGHIEIYVKR